MGFLFPLSCLLLLAFRSAQTARLVTRASKLIKTHSAQFKPRQTSREPDKLSSADPRPNSPAPPPPCGPHPGMPGFLHRPHSQTSAPRPGAVITQKRGWEPYLVGTPAALGAASAPACAARTSRRAQFHARPACLLTARSGGCQKEAG